MKTVKITARYKKWTPDMEDFTPKTNGVYKVRSLEESHSGGKGIHVWGWKSSQKLDDDWEMMINGQPVKWE